MPWSLPEHIREKSKQSSSPKDEEALIFKSSTEFKGLLAGETISGCFGVSS
jgi:hypothetical protein